MRILLDENAPSGLRRILAGHDVRTAPEMGWARYSNGQLLDEAEKAGFEALITGDRSLPFQQNLTGRNIAVIIFSTNAWPIIRTQPQMAWLSCCRLLSDRFCQAVPSVTSAMVSPLPGRTPCRPKPAPIPARCQCPAVRQADGGDPRARFADCRPAPSSLGITPADRYPLDELLADVNSEHNIVATVFIQRGWGYRTSGPEEMHPIGESEFVRAIAEETDRRGGKTKICAGIVSFADLRRPNVNAVLQGQIAACREACVIRPGRMPTLGVTRRCGQSLACYVPRRPM